MTLTGALALPWFAARAQAAKVRRIGLIYPAASSPASNLAALKDALRDLGWSEGKNLVFEVRSADGDVGKLPAFAAELVKLPVEVLITGGSEATQAGKLATASIPIVFQGPSYPVERPGKFDLVINLKAARALGLAIPQSVLQRADEFIK